jgi:hypothetical protein
MSSAVAPACCAAPCESALSLPAAQNVAHACSYDFTARVTNTKFDRKYWHIVECELGRMFRSPGFNKQYRKREQPVVYLPARELWRQRQQQRQNAHLVSGRPATSGGKTPSRSQTGRIPLYGLVAATGQSPMILSAFRKPMPPGQTPPSTAPGRSRRRPNTQGSSRPTTAASGSRSARTYGRGSGGVQRVVPPVSSMGRTQAW